MKRFIKLIHSLTTKRVRSNLLNRDSLTPFFILLMMLTGVLLVIIFNN